MDPLFATLVLILLALLGARVSFSTQRVPPGPRLLFRTGMHWLALGFLLGPAGLAFFTGDALRDLNPLLALGLGWVGLLFGLQLDRSTLRQFPLSHHVLALGQAVVTFFVFLAVGRLVLEGGGLREGSVPLLLMGAAATAAVSTPAGIALVSSNFLVRGKVRELLFLVASIDAVVGVAALQVTYALHHPGDFVAGLGQPTAVLSLGLALGLGVTCAILLLWLLRTRPGPEELVLFLLGIAALGSGAALQLHLSPLFVTVIMGAVVANLARDPQRIYRVLQGWEKPIYVVLLLLAGALLSVESWWVVPLAVGYTLVRAVGKVTGTWALVRLLPLSFRPPAGTGLGLVPQGGISLAMAVSLVLTYGAVEGTATVGVSMVFTVVVLGVALSELVGPFLTTRVLRGAGEISRQVEEALEEGDEDRATAAAIRHGPEGDGPGASERPDGG